MRDKEFDFGELAIVTYLQAKSFGTPYCLLPATVVGRGQHHTIAYNPENGALKPQDLNGKRVGLRAYSVTTATWVRGILAEEHGIDLDSVKWTTFEDPHVAEYKDPADRHPGAGRQGDRHRCCSTASSTPRCVGDKLPDPRLKQLIPDAEDAARAVGAEERRRADQSHGGCARHHREITPGRGEGGLPAAGREQARG